MKKNVNKDKPEPKPPRGMPAASEKLIWELFHDPIRSPERQEVPRSPPRWVDIYKTDSLERIRFELLHDPYVVFDLVFGPQQVFFQQTNVSNLDDLVTTKTLRLKKFATYTATENASFAERFLLKMLSCKGVSKHVHTIEILRLSYLATKIFTEQGRMVEVDGPIRICGDIHGQYSDLIRLFDKAGFPPDSNYIFLGDYVDRGRNSLEVLLLCLAYKVRYPGNFYMLRGNHECSHINSIYGFRDEIFTRRVMNCDIIYDDLSDMMDMMPLTGLIGRRILCMHGGISPKLRKLDDLRKLQAPFNGSNNDSLEMDVLWADPMSNQTGFQPNMRGASVSFGEDMVAKCCKDLDIDLIVRAHQVVQDGYEFFAGRKLITIFSAPNYCGQFDNSSAVCVVSEGLEVSFEVLKPEGNVVEKSQFEKTEKTDVSVTQDK